MVELLSVKNNVHPGRKIRHIYGTYTAVYGEVTTKNTVILNHRPGHLPHNTWITWTTNKPHRRRWMNDKIRHRIITMIPCFHPEKIPIQFIAKPTIKPRATAVMDFRYLCPTKRNTKISSSWKRFSDQNFVWSSKDVRTSSQCIYSILVSLFWSNHEWIYLQKVDRMTSNWKYSFRFNSRSI